MKYLLLTILLSSSGLAFSQEKMGERVDKLSQNYNVQTEMTESEYAKEVLYKCTYKLRSSELQGETKAGNCIVEMNYVLKVSDYSGQSDITEVLVDVNRVINLENDLDPEVLESDYRQSTFFIYGM